MKKKILSLMLVFVLILSSIFILTACGDEEDDEDEKKSSSKSNKEEIVVTADEVDKTDVKSVIKAAIEAINNEDAEELVELIDLKNAGKELKLNNPKKKDFINLVNKEFFNDYDFEFKVGKIQLLENDEKLLEEIHSNIEELKKSPEYYEYVYYTVELEPKTDALREYIKDKNMSQNSIDGYDLEKNIEKFKDIIVLSEDDGEYKIVLSSQIASIISAQQNVLSTAEKALEKTDKAEAEGALLLALNSIVTEFMGDVWVNDTSKKIVDYVKYSDLNEKLELSNYVLVGDDTGLIFTNNEKEVIVKFKGKNSRTVYKATILVASDINLSFKNVEVEN